jgi:hypothetical protein
MEASMNNSTGKCKELVGLIKESQKYEWKNGGTKGRINVVGNAIVLAATLGGFGTATYDVIADKPPFNKFIHSEETPVRSTQLLHPSLQTKHSL